MSILSGQASMFPIKEKHNKSNLVQGPYAIV